MQKSTSISRRAQLIFWLLHVLLVYLMFTQAILHPNSTMFHPVGDGLKNYFTLQAYIAQPADAGMANFTAMQYPYGESVWYTDNSPLIACLMRAFSLHISDISTAAVPIFNWLMILQILLAPIVLLNILRRLLTQEVLIVCGALVVMWMSPQLLRMFTGTMNLSMMIWYFLVIWQMLRLYDAWKFGNKRQIYLSSVWICLVICLAAFIHLYYLLLLGMPVMLFVAIYARLGQSTLRAEWKYYVWPLLAVCVSVILVLLSIQLTDPHLSMRTGRPDGVSISAWEIRFYHFYKAKDGVNLLQFLGGKMHFEQEQGPYLGLFFWLAGIMSIVLYVIHSRKTASWKVHMSRPVSASLWVLFFVYFTGVGMEIIVFRDDFMMKNYFNPLYYVATYYPPIEHFRCIGRMGWWIFYAAHFGLFIVLDRFAFVHFKKFTTVIVLILTLITGIDLIGIGKLAKWNTNENQFSAANMNRLPDINYADYQAILPIPYYNVGSEDYPYTIDDVDAWSAFTYRLQLKSALPLMSVKLSRTPKTFAHDYIQMFLDGEMPETLKDNMNDKPILVVYDSSVKPATAREPAATANQRAPLLIEHQKMQLVMETGTIRYYAWYLP